MCGVPPRDTPPHTGAKGVGEAELELINTDIQPTWREYSEALGFRFKVRPEPEPEPQPEPEPRTRTRTQAQSQP